MSTQAGHAGEELLLGIDVGSSGTKAVLADARGNVVARAEVPHRIGHPRPGWAEQDAEKDWWGGLLRVCAQLSPGGHGRVVGIGVDGLGPCLVPTGAGGEPLRPAILYGVDTRARDEIEELNDRLGKDAVLRRCGSPLTSQSLGPKLLWLVRNEPDVAKRTRLWFTCSSYLVHKLTGAWVLDHHSASQCGPLYDVHRNCWIPGWAAAAAPGLPLPPLVWPQEVVGTLSPRAAQETGLPAGTPVIAGSIDSWAEVVASGLRSPGAGLLAFGTTLFMIQVHATARPDRRLWSTTGFGPGDRNLAAGMSSAGALLGWLHGLTASTFQELDEEAAGVPAGAGGLLVLPYFNGERTPLFDPDARGVIAGLTVAHTRAHLQRALMEATALGIRHNLETMAAAGAPVATLLAAGGGTRSELWMRIVASVTGLDLRVLRESMGASLGAALLAAIGTGRADLATTWNGPSRVYSPDARDAVTYDDLFALYKRLHDQTADTQHTLAGLQRRHQDGRP